MAYITGDLLAVPALQVQGRAEDVHNWQFVLCDILLG